MAENNSLYIIVGIIILLAFAFPIKKVTQEESDVSFKAHFYDENGKEIIYKNSNLFSIASEGLEEDIMVNKTEENLTLFSAKVGDMEEAKYGDNPPGIVEGQGIIEIEDSGPAYNPPKTTDNIFSIFSLFSISSTTTEVNIQASRTERYCLNYDSSSGFYYTRTSNFLYYLGSTVYSPGSDYRKCHALLLFPVTELPVGFNPQNIESATLNFATSGIRSDEGNGATLSFYVFPQLETYPLESNTDNSNDIFYHGLKGEPYATYGPLGSLISSYAYKDVTDENKIFGLSMAPVLNELKTEISQNLDGVPTQYFAVAVVGEEDTSDNEFVTLQQGTALKIIYYPETQNPAYMSLELLVQNPTDFTFTNLKISSASPAPFSSALPTTSYTLSPGGYKYFTSSLFEYDPSWADSTVFQACVSGDGPTGTITKCGQTTLGTVTYGPPICGNNRLESGEQCDDGNLINGDGCSSICMVEGGGGGGGG